MHPILSAFLKLGVVAVIVNEIRGLVLALPVFYGIYQAGGTWAAIWLGVCSLFGIAMSVVVPVFVAKRIRPLLEKRFPSAFRKSQTPRDGEEGPVLLIGSSGVNPSALDRAVREQDEYYGRV